MANPKAKSEKLSADDGVPLPEGVKLVPFDPERDMAPEGGEQDCDGDPR